MTLALRLGRTVGELMQSMSAAELMLWQAYAALVASSVFQAQGAKVSLADVLPTWQANDKPPDDGWEAFMRAMAARQEGME